MKRNWKQIVGLAFIVAAATSAGAAAATWSTAQDRAAVVPGMKVLLDNDCVRVQYHDVAVGQKVPMHSHPNYIVYTLKPFEARITLPDGTERISKREAGVAYWNEALTHSVENLGSTDIHNLIIELKPGTSCRTPATSEVEKVKPAQIRVYQPGDPKDLLFEAGATAPNSARLLTSGDETGRAWSLVELTEMPGTKTTWHRHPHFDQAYYVLEGVFTAKVEDKTYQLSKGGYVFIPRGTPHGTGNVGSVPVKVLLINGPAGFERYFQARADLLKTIAPQNPAFRERMSELRKQFDTEELGVWDPGPSAADGPPDEEVVRKLDDEERIAALKLDFAALERLWSEHFIVNAPSNQILPNRSAVLDWFRKGMTTRSSFERSVERVRVDGDIAIVMGAETLTPTANAPLAGQTVRRRFTNIWKKENGTWRLWARHANVIAAPAAAKTN